MERSLRRRPKIDPAGVQPWTANSVRQQPSCSISRVNSESDRFACRAPKSGQLAIVGRQPGRGLSRRFNSPQNLVAGESRPAISRTRAIGPSRFSDQTHVSKTEADAVVSTASASFFCPTARTLTCYAFLDDPGKSCF